MALEPRTVSTQRTLTRALASWPASVPLSGVSVTPNGTPLGQADGRCTQAHKNALRAAGWESTSKGRWVLLTRKRAIPSSSATSCAGHGTARTGRRSATGRTSGWCAGSTPTGPRRS